MKKFILIVSLVLFSVVLSAKIININSISFKGNAEMAVLPNSSEMVSCSDTLIQENVDLCWGDSIDFNGINITTSGTYYDTIITALGCDSVLSLIVNLLNTDSSYVQTTICIGDSLLINGTYRNTTGLYTYTLNNDNGCDSTIFFQLNALGSFPKSDTLHLCQGDSVFLSGMYQTTPGVYLDTIPINGTCDSVRTSFLMVHSPYLIQQDIDICLGDSFFAGGQYRDTAGFFTDNYTSVYGCDSIVEIQLSVNQYIHTFDTLWICPGDSLLFAETYLYSSGDYSDTINSGMMCDLISFLRVNYYHNASPGIAVADAVICKNDGTVDLKDYLIGEDAGGKWTDLDTSNGIILNQFYPFLVETGTYSFQYTVFSDTSCPSSVVLSIEVDDCLSVSENKKEQNGLKIYPNPFNTGIHIALANNEIPVAIYIIDQRGRIVLKKNNVSYLDLDFLRAGMYTITVETKDKTHQSRIVKE